MSRLPQRARATPMSRPRRSSCSSVSKQSDFYRDCERLEDAALLSKDRRLAGDRMPSISADSNGEDFADERDPLCHFSEVR